MDYLKLLPLNVHEEIIHRFPQEKKSIKMQITESDYFFLITFNIQKLFDASKEVNNVLNQWYPNMNFNNIISKKEYNINQITYYKDSNIFFVNQATSSYGFLFDAKQKIYFDTRECLYLDINQASMMLKLFKDWSRCSKCLEDKEISLLLKQKCIMCHVKLEPGHITCFSKCKQSHRHIEVNKFICDGCSVQCEYCNQTLCRNHIIKCSYNRNFCYDCHLGCFWCKIFKVVTKYLGFK